MLLSPLLFKAIADCVLAYCTAVDVLSVIGQCHLF